MLVLSPCLAEPNLIFDINIDLFVIERTGKKDIIIVRLISTEGSVNCSLTAASGCPY